MIIIVMIKMIRMQILRALQGSERGAMGSKNPPPCILEPLLFSARRGSKNPGFVRRPLSPRCHCLVGCCLVIPDNYTRIIIIIITIISSIISLVL